MKLTLDGNTYVAESTFDERAIPKQAGFRWDPARKRWYTTEVARAALLAQYADESCANALQARAAARTEAIAASRAAEADVEIPVPTGLDYLPFQRAGIAYGASRSAVLIADEMGLGKTIQAIGILNADTTIRRAIVVCPASLKLNWQRELTKWLVDPRRIEIVTSTDWPQAEIVIVNYDILHKHAANIEAHNADALIADEAHYAKNKKSRRAKALFSIKARKRVFLTGTPIVNRPVELLPILEAIGGETMERVGGGWRYLRRYCDGKQTRSGWDFSGAANLEELQDILRETCMVRRLKSAVLTELPAKRRQIVEIAQNGSAKLVARESAAIAQSEATLGRLAAAVEIAKTLDQAAYEQAVSELAFAQRATFAEMSALRHETALAKVPYVIEHVETAIGEGEHKLVLFAHHHDVVAAFAEAFGSRCVTLTGETPMADRQAAVDRFQSDPTCQVFIGSITAAGVGLTLTAASHVVFAELDWVPGNMSQAEDRCHRIGQTDSVLVQHLVLDGSLDARLAKTLIAKQAVIDRAMDSTERADLTVPVAATRDEAATANTSRKKIAEEADRMTDEQVALAHEAVRFLKARCDGAMTEDGAGFSKIDRAIGHDLAERPSLTRKQAALARRIALRYARTQLPEAIAEGLRSLAA